MRPLTLLITLLALIISSCWGAQLIRRPQRHTFAPENIPDPIGEVRFPEKKMEGLAGIPTTDAEIVANREKAYELMFNTCEGAYRQLDEKRKVAENDGVWIHIYFLCEEDTDAGLMEDEYEEKIDASVPEEVMATTDGGVAKPMTPTQDGGT